MSSTADKLEQEIKTLPDIEKLRLVDAILADLDRPDPEIDRIWAEEVRNLGNRAPRGRGGRADSADLSGRAARRECARAGCGARGPARAPLRRH